MDTNENVRVWHSVEFANDACTDEEICIDVILDACFFAMPTKQDLLNMAPDVFDMIHIHKIKQGIKTGTIYSVSPAICILHNELYYY